MPIVTVPATTDHPERWTVVQELLRAGMKCGRVVSFTGPGDPGSERDRDGVPRETALYLTLEDEPWTAVRQPDGWHSWPGWGSRPT